MLQPQSNYHPSSKSLTSWRSSSILQLFFSRLNGKSAFSNQQIRWGTQIFSGLPSDWQCHHPSVEPNVSTTPPSPALATEPKKEGAPLRWERQQSAGFVGDLVLNNWWIHGDFLWDLKLGYKGLHGIKKPWYFMVVLSRLFAFLLGNPLLGESQNLFWGPSQAPSHLVHPQRDHSNIGTISTSYGYCWYTAGILISYGEI